MTETRIQQWRRAWRKDNERTGREWDAFLTRHKDPQSPAAQAEACELGVMQAQRNKAVDRKYFPWIK